MQEVQSKTRKLSARVSRSRNSTLHINHVVTPSPVDVSRRDESILGRNQVRTPQNHRDPENQHAQLGLNREFNGKPPKSRFFKDSSATPCVHVPTPTIIQHTSTRRIGHWSVPPQAHTTSHTNPQIPRHLDQNPRFPTPTSTNHGRTRLNYADPYDANHGASESHTGTTGAPQNAPGRRHRNTNEVSISVQRPPCPFVDPTGRETEALFATKSLF